VTAFLDIDLGAIQDNWRRLDALHPGETAGVLKADAYGLGAARVGPALAAAGCRLFFTAHLTEAVALREVLPGQKIAVLNGLFPHRAADFYDHDLIPVLSSLAELADWRAAAKRLGRALPCFLHVETGMNRLGLTAAERAVLASDRQLLDGLRIEYVLTHLLAADEPGDAANAHQLKLFTALAAQFPGVKTSISNSSGMFLGQDFYTDLARPGAALYGVNPTPGSENPMRQVVRLTAPILQIHDVAAGEGVGYSGAWQAARPSRIATIGVGYADGYLRSLTNKATAYFDDTRVPLVGRVSMDLTNFDVTAVNAAPGDLLTLLGPRHDADALAAEAGTNGYEILTSLGSRFTRRYTGA
jgi:alanine racemase